MANPIGFRGANLLLKGNPGQGVQDLRAFKAEDGVIWSRWQFDVDEMAEILATSSVWVGLSTYGRPPQPITVTGQEREILPDRPAPIGSDCVVVAREDFERLRAAAGIPGMSVLTQEEREVLSAKAITGQGLEAVQKAKRLARDQMRDVAKGDRDHPNKKRKG